MFTSEDFDKGSKLLTDVLNVINEGQYTILQVLATLAAISWVIALDVGPAGVAALNNLHQDNLIRFADGAYSAETN